MRGSIVLIGLVFLLLAAVTGCEGAAFEGAFSSTSKMTSAPTATTAPFATSTSTFTLTPTPAPGATSTSTAEPLEGAVATVQPPTVFSLGPSPSVPAATAPGPALPSTVRVITLDDNGKILDFKIGGFFELGLGPGATPWIPQASDLDVVRPIEGTPGLYETFAPGVVTIKLAIQPACFNNHPACMLPARLFSVTIKVT